MNRNDTPDAHRRWVLKKRRNAYRNILKIIGIHLSRMAARAALRRRRRWQEPQTPQINPVDEFRREIMPIVAQMAELAGGDPKPFLELAKPKRRASRGKSERGD